MTTEQSGSPQKEFATDHFWRKAVFHQIVPSKIILKIAKKHTASWLSTVGSQPLGRAPRSMLNVFNDIEERVGRIGDHRSC